MDETLFSPTIPIQLVNSFPPSSIPIQEKSCKACLVISYGQKIFPEDVEF